MTEETNGVFRTLSGNVIDTAGNIAGRYDFAATQDAADEVETYDYGIANYATSIVSTAVFVYAHWSLSHEIKQGIMSQETYATTEAHSCCCVTVAADVQDEDDKEEDLENQQEEVADVAQHGVE